MGSKKWSFLSEMAAIWLLLMIYVLLRQANKVLIRILRRRAAIAHRRRMAMYYSEATTTATTTTAVATTTTASVATTTKRRKSRRSRDAAAAAAAAASAAAAAAAALQSCPPNQSQPNLLEPAPMGNAHGQNRTAGSGSSPQATGSLLRLAAGGRHGPGCMPPLAALEDRRNSSHQQARVFSRFVKQKRDVFLQATPPVSPASLPATPLTEWTPPDVGHGQLNASAEQMDFHLNNKELIELKRRCRADKIAGLSLSRITYLSIAHESEPDPEQALEAELLHTDLLITPESSPDERMALQLGKKLAQVLGSGSVTPTPTPPGSLTESNMMPVGVAATPRVDSPLGNGGELFNISKAKKVELQNLSSRFTAAVSPASTPTNLTDAGVAATAAATPTPTPAPTPTPTSTPTPTPTSISVSTATTPLETQSTVIISFKSSQTPASAQRSASPTESSAAGEALLQGDEARQLDADAASLVPPPPGYGTPTNPLLSSNVLKKVASFSVERSTSTSSGCNSSSAPSVQSPALAMAAPSGDERETTLTAAQLEQSLAAGAGSRRGSSFVPEKLSFAAYEKFEGYLLVMLLLRSCSCQCFVVSCVQRFIFSALLSVVWGESVWAVCVRIATLAPASQSPSTSLSA
ncbi:hypothetical protein AWZ03_000249 [Drosophila navojoa]|uniref:Uncharacterized protein n=1 Tax=Drosophila navojoa TaxID=7232 RepID=A0A484BXN0_DRONA|nr:hypothetical protein AWZ03_000249 [Drosophila navojoa]